MNHTLSRFNRTIVLFALVALFVVSSATSAFAISRATTLSRAQSWVDSPVPYSQRAWHKGYRTDCSGYVSMCWQTGTSWWTAVFHKVTTPIAVEQLQPGDAMLKPGYHIRLFYAWLDEEHTQYVAYESGYGKVAVVRIHSMAEDLADGYKPVRYDRITYSPASRNLLKNGAFNSWATSWAGVQPVWWQLSGDTPDQPLYRHRRAVYRSGTHSMELLNPSDDPAKFTYLQQAARVQPGVEYRSSAWVTTAHDPAAVSLWVQYFDAGGQAIAETSTTGVEAGIGADAFRRMTVISTTPSEAVAAQVTVRLGGGSSVDASGNPVPGTKVVVDDVSLYRPFVGVGIGRSTSSTYRGRTVKLSGSVTPAAAVGTTATVQIRKPGGSWTPLKNVVVKPSGSAGAWSTSYTFSRTAPKGTYWFRTSVAGIPGYVGTTSAQTHVIVK